MKKLLSIVLGLLLIGGSAFAAQKRVKNANPFSVFQAIKVTSNGSLSGTCFFEANSGVVSDCDGNAFLTGEIDPIWSAVSGNYVLYSGAAQNIYLANNNLIFDQGNMGGIIFSSGGSTFDGSTIMSFANNQLSFAGQDYGVNFDMSLLGSDITAYFPPVSGTFLFDSTLTGYLTGYTPRTNVDTGFNNTGSNTIILSEKAVWGLFGGLTNSYIPYWSGNKLYNSAIQHIGLNYTRIFGYLDGVDSAFLSSTYTGGVAIGGEAMYGGVAVSARATTKPGYTGYNFYANIDDTNHNTVGMLLRVGNGNITGNAIQIENEYGPNTGIVLTIEKQGNISTRGNIRINNGTDVPFRFAYSGGLMEGQYFTGGERRTSYPYPMP